MATTFTLAELKGMETPLTKLLEQEIPVKSSFKLSKVLRDISKELSVLEDSRQNLIRQYGEVQENGSTTITDPENLASFQSEFGDLLNEEVTFEYDPISIDLLGDNLNLTVAEVTVLSGLFEE